MDFSFLKVLLLSILCLLPSFSESYDFCSNQKEENVCGVGKRHVVCNPDSMPMTGKFIIAAPMTFKLMRDLLKEINTIRNQVAGGTEKNSAGVAFPKAESMREILWNNELEYIAHHHAVRCSIKDDECHSSIKFKHAGEINGVYGNTEMIGFSETFKHVFGKIREQKNSISDPTLITKKFTKEFGKTAPDFVLLVNDQVSHAGCAVAYCTNCEDDKGSKQNHCFYVTCIFNAINMQNCTIYDDAKGISAGNCGKYGGKKSETYEHLCTGNDEQYENKCLKKEPPPKPPPRPPRPPATKPPATKPPATKPPATKPPATKPPSGPTTKPPLIPDFELDKYGYCALPPKKICPLDPHKEHIVCFPEQLPLNGTLVEIIRATAENKKMVLDYHNRYRNDVASGNEKNINLGVNYPQAARMRELVWNDELAYIAEHHTRRCHFEHSHCHTTHEILFGGQNLGYVEARSERNFLRVANVSMYYWYIEKDKVRDPVFTPHCYDKSIGEVGAGHFTVLINDQISRVGCTVSQCRKCYNMDEHTDRCYHYACHYDMGNVYDYGLYKKGPATSLCKTDFNLEVSSNYKYLCAPTEAYLPKRFWNEKNMHGMSVEDVANG